MPQMEFNPEFGRKIRELRQRDNHKIGLRELARRVDISPSYLSQIETGKLPPPSNFFLVTALAHELNVDAIDLLEYARPPKHSLSEVLQLHPEVPNLLASFLSRLDEEHINPAIVSFSVSSIVRDEYGLNLSKPDQSELKRLTDMVIRILRSLRKRER